MVAKCRVSVTSLPNARIFDWSKFKAFADDKTHVTQKLKLVLGGTEDIFGEKEENADNQHFLLFSQNVF